MADRSLDSDAQRPPQGSSTGTDDSLNPSSSMAIDVDEGIFSVVPTHRYDLQILQSLRRIIRAIDLYSGRLRMTCDITVPQLISLLAIVESGSLTATDLAKRAYLSTSTIIGIIDRLERKGLVKRVRNRRDRRVIDISATEKGVALAKAAPSPLQENLADSLKRLPEVEQGTIACALERVVELMEAQKLGAVPILELGRIEQGAAGRAPSEQNDMEGGSENID